MTLMRFVSCIFIVILGIIGFITFAILQNYNGSVFSILTAIVNASLAHLHFLHYKQRLLEWYTSDIIIRIGNFGFFMFTLGTVALTYYITLEALLIKPILPINESLIFPIIGSFLTAISGLLLLYYGRVYSRTEEQPLITEQEEN